MIQRYDFNLTDEPDENGFQPFMAAGILTGDADEALRPAIVICPGGGYYGVCEYWEGERFAMAYAAAGFNTIVVNYTTHGGGTYPRQLFSDYQRTCRGMAYRSEQDRSVRFFCRRTPGSIIVYSVELGRYFYERRNRITRDAP